MRHLTRIKAVHAAVAAALLIGAAPSVNADVISDWNIKSAELITESKLGTPPAMRVMAIVQTAAFEAANAVTGRYPEQRPRQKSTPGASVDAAIAAAHRVTLAKLIPAQQATIESAYRAALAHVADGPAKAAGIAVGERAASAVLAERVDDDASKPEAYRPHAAAGTYVPTVIPAVTQWPQRKPWLLKSATQFRPAPPPALTSEAWVRDFNEVKMLGARNSTRRSAEQTEIALFWDYSMPAIYHGVVRSVTNAPGREVTQNARLFAAVAQAMDDALIAVFEAKYHYNFWRPVTAIRNADIDGNDATQRDGSWASLIDAPMHPEYASGHSILAASIAEVLKADLGTSSTPTFTTSSPTAKGAARRWATLEDFVKEVSNARIYGGIHFRAATDAGEQMGKQIGALAAMKFFQETD